MAIITISRQVGSFGNRIAHELANELQYGLLDRETISKLLMESGFSEKKEIETFSAEKEPSFLDSFVLDRNRLLHYIRKAIYDFAEQDNVIIMGMGGQILFHDFPNTLRTRVMAPKEVRLRRVQKWQDCDEHHAEHIVHDSDHARASFNKYFFNIDWEAPDLYDLIINTEKIGRESTIRLLKEGEQELVQQGQQQVMLKKLKKQVLEQQILIRILYEEQLQLPSLTVDVDDGHIVLRGFCQSFDDMKACEKIAREVSGIEDVRNEIVKMPD